MEWLLVVILLLCAILAVFCLVGSLYIDYVKPRKTTRNPDWVWQNISLHIDGLHRNSHILVNHDNGFIVAKVICRGSGLCEAYYKGQLVGEYRNNTVGIDTAIEHINSRMNLNKLGVK